MFRRRTLVFLSLSLGVELYFYDCGVFFSSPSPCEMRAVTVYFQERLAGPWKTHPYLRWVETSRAPLSRAEPSRGGAVDEFSLMA